MRSRNWCRPSPPEVAALVGFSDRGQAGYITQQVISINGRMA
jgi:hypothetical protein